MFVQIPVLTNAILVMAHPRRSLPDLSRIGAQGRVSLLARP